MVITFSLCNLSIAADFTRRPMGNQLMVNAVAGRTSMVESKSSACICPRCGWRSPWSTFQNAWQP